MLLQMVFQMHSQMGLVVRGYAVVAPAHVVYSHPIAMSVLVFRHMLMLINVQFLLVAVTYSFSGGEKWPVNFAVDFFSAAASHCVSPL